MSMYVDMPSVYITILGSVFICMMKFNLGQFLMAFKVAGKAFMYKGTSSTISSPRRWNWRMRPARGFLALEAAEIPKPL